jgi:hypothetical protein
MADGPGHRQHSEVPDGVVVPPRDDGPQVWMQKLSAVETERTRAHAATQRARVVGALEDVRNDSVAVLLRTAQTLSRDVLINGTVACSYIKHMMEAVREVAADPQWQDKQEVLDRTDRTTLDEDSGTRLAEYNLEYFKRIHAGIVALDARLRAELERQTDAVLRQLYIGAFIEQRAATVTAKESQVARIVAAARMCQADPDDQGSYANVDHSGCKHEPLFVDEPVVDGSAGPLLNRDGSPRALTAYEQVRSLPDAVFAIYARAADSVS